MSLFAEFRVPATEFALHRTLDQLPDAVLEIDRVAASEELLTPYFWVSGVDLDAFEAAAGADPSVENLRRLDEFEEATLYRASWTKNVDTIVYAYTHVDATVLEAKGEAGHWIIRMRFDGHEPLENFCAYTERRDISFGLNRLYEISHARSGSQYGLTEKQHEALITAWEMGYFEEPRETTLEAVAAELDITRQSLSQRLRRAEHALVANTIRVTPPDEDRSDTTPDMKT